MDLFDYVFRVVREPTFHLDFPKGEDVERIVGVTGIKDGFTCVEVEDFHFFKKEVAVGVVEKFENGYFVNELFTRVFHDGHTFMFELIDIHISGFGRHWDFFFGERIVDRCQKLILSFEVIGVICKVDVDHVLVGAVFHFGDPHDRHRVF